jgi:hypothetical protein
MKGLVAAPKSRSSAAFSSLFFESDKLIDNGRQAAPSAK